MNSKYVPGDNLILTSEDGDATLGLSGRAWDEMGHDLVVIQLAQRQVMYGEWIARFQANGNDFDVEILSFGFREGYLAGSPNLDDRVIFTKAEQQVIEMLIRRLFASSVIQSAGVPFSISGARFLGGVRFSPDWIRLG